MDKEERDATAIVVANAFGAMMKVFLVSIVGVLSAKYPKGFAKTYFHISSPL
jgi:hypothetical protein